jgi:alkanesulfonate monooxygenase SsuD/methylene tetrahydromethanopterin reductase-like flavin-dependent oxidoreductase (luciferase family)
MADEENSRASWEQPNGVRGHAAMRVGISLDLRNPEPWKRPWDEHYARTLEFIEEADRLGVDAVAMAEHHQWDDGYCPRPMTALAAVASRTKNIRLATLILLLPLYDASSLAEEAGMIDCISGGRLELGLGIGYRRSEFELFGRSFADRYRFYESQVARLRELWGPDGITPAPLQNPLPLWAGLRGPRTSYLAGRLGMGMLSMQGDFWERYLEGLRDGGHGEGAARLGGPAQAMLADDPDEAFAVLGPRFVSQWAAYERYALTGTDKTPPPPLSAEEYREIGAFTKMQGQSKRDVGIGGPARAYGFSIWTPDEAAATIKEVAAGRKVDIVYLCGAPSGQIDDLAYRNLELIVNELKPRLADLSER